MLELNLVFLLSCAHQANQILDWQLFPYKRHRLEHWECTYVDFKVSYTGMAVYNSNDTKIAQGDEMLSGCSPDLCSDVLLSMFQNLAERKKKSLLERSQAEEEVDEIRRSYQEELDKLRQLLKKARTSTDQAATEQVKGAPPVG